MRRVFLVALGAIFLGSGIAKAAPNQELSRLKKQQKMERRQLKQQQRVTRRTMGQHPMTKEAHARMEQDLKMQRRLLKNNQKAAIRNLKQGSKPAKRRAKNTRSRSKLP
jgi:hypothetical protein